MANLGGGGDCRVVEVLRGTLKGCVGWERDFWHPLELYFFTEGCGWLFPIIRCIRIIACNRENIFISKCFPRNGVSNRFDKRKLLIE